jgi:hypothetical protein
LGIFWFIADFIDSSLMKILKSQLSEPRRLDEGGGG